MKKRGRPPKLITDIKPEDIKVYAPAISETKRRIDELRAQLKDIFKLYNERNARRPIQFTIDESAMTIHFMGANKGLECTTLHQPDKTIYKVARNYMVPTIAAQGEVDMEEAARLARRLANR